MLSQWQYANLLELLVEYDEAKYPGKYSGSSEQQDIGSVFYQVRWSYDHDYPNHAKLKKELR